MQLEKASEMPYFPPLAYQLRLKNTDLRQLVKKGASSLIAFLPVRLNFQDSVCGAAGGWALAFLLITFPCLKGEQPKTGKSGIPTNF